MNTYKDMIIQIYHLHILLFLVVISKCIRGRLDQFVTDHEKWTNHCQGNLIVAGATGYTVRDIRTFLLSYNITATSSNSRLLLLFSENQRNQRLLHNFLSIFKKLNIEIIYIQPSSQHVGNSRFQWLKDYLEDQLVNKTNRFCHIFSTDLRDVYFQQGNFFDEIEYYKLSHQIRSDQNYVILSQEGLEGGKLMKDCPYHIEAATRSCMKSIITDYTTFMNNKIICSGAIVGSHSGVILLFGLITNLMKKIDSNCLTQPMTDQIILNIVVYETLQLQSIRLVVSIPDNFYSPMLTMGYIPESYFKIDRSNSIFTEKSSVGVAIITIQLEKYRQKGRISSILTSPSSKTFSSSTSLSRRVPTYVHQYDRFIEIRKSINMGLGCAREQYFGDFGTFTNMKSLNQKKLQQESSLQKQIH